MSNGDTLIFDLPQDIYLDDEIEVNGKLVKRLVEIGEERQERYNTLQEYYNGHAIIQDRERDDDKANNKLVSGYPSYIVDVIQGYFIGKPVRYTVSEEEQDNMDIITEIFDRNEEQDENSELAKICGIKGRAYELVYVDEQGEVRFNQLEPDNVLYAYDTQINPEPLLAIRWYNDFDVYSDDNEGDLIVHVYTRNEEIIYREIDGELREDELIPHVFEMVPMIEYMNNDEGLGDFERVLSLIDAYNKAQSDTANDFEEFTDAFLGLGNMQGTTVEDILRLKKERVILYGENQDAKWITKEVNDIALENYKNRLDNDIHKFSKVPNMSDEKFAGNVSGESMKYKLLALDQLILTKQRKFKASLQRRLDILTRIESLKSTGEDGFAYTDIDIKFTLNKPINEKELVDMGIALKGITSDITAFSKLSEVTGVEASEEMERLEEEVDPYEVDFTQNLEVEIDEKADF